MAEKKQKVINYMPKTSSQKIWDGDTNLSIVYKMFLNKLYANTQEREAEPRAQGISIQRPSRDGMASKEVEHGSMNGEGGRWELEKQCHGNNEETFKETANSIEFCKENQMINTYMWF